jgi:hypothetical protein
MNNGFSTKEYLFRRMAYIIDFSLSCLEKLLQSFYLDFWLLVLVDIEFELLDFETIPLSLIDSFFDLAAEQAIFIE